MCSPAHRHRWSHTIGKDTLGLWESQGWDPGVSSHPQKDASCLICSPPTPAMMILCDPGLVSGPRCPHHITEQVHPCLPSNFTPGLRSGPQQAGTQRVTPGIHPGQLQILVFLETLKSSRPRPRRSPRGAWSAEGGLVEPGVCPVGAETSPALLLPAGVLA